MMIDYRAADVWKDYLNNTHLWKDCQQDINLKLLDSNPHDSGRLEKQKNKSAYFVDSFATPDVFRDAEV